MVFRIRPQCVAHLRGKGNLYFAKFGKNIFELFPKLEIYPEQPQKSHKNAQKDQSHQTFGHKKHKNSPCEGTHRGA